MEVDMPAQADLFTVSDLELLPDDGNRYEVIEGELYVSTAPTVWHQDLIAQLTAEMVFYLRDHPIGKVWPGVGIVFDEFNGVIPDLLCVSNERAATVVDKGRLWAAPELVAEVISPGSENEKRDRVLKKKLYSARGVKEYWIFDQERREVEILRPRETGGLELATKLAANDDLTTPLLPGFRCPVSRLFSA
jgi:Uma2 family endonuclease